MGKEMTREQLYGMIGEIVGTTVKEMLDPIKQQQTDLMSNILRGQNKSEEKPLDKGLIIGRFIRALAAGKGDPDRAANYAKKNWQDETGKEVCKALAAGDATAGGFLVPEVFSREIIELLRPMSVVRRMNPVSVDLSGGTLRIPKLAGGATATYIGENRNVVETQQQTGQVVLSAKKLAALVPVSNDLLRVPGTGADSIIRNDTVAAMAEREDLAFIRDDGTLNTPKGLRFHAPLANILTANPTVNLNNVTSDIGRMILQLKQGNVRMIRPGWLWAPRTEIFLMLLRDGNGNLAFRDEMARGTFFGWPFASTTQIPVNLNGDESEIYLTDFADALLGEMMGLIIDASTEAAYVDASGVVAAFSLDQTVIRAIAQHDFAMRHDESVTVLDNVTWTP